MTGSLQVQGAFRGISNYYDPLESGDIIPILMLHLKCVTHARAWDGALSEERTDAYE